MHDLLARMRKSPFFPGAIIAPLLIAFIFSVFNLSAAPDQARIQAAVTLGLVNLDEGAAPLPVKIGDQLATSLAANAPFVISAFESEDAARQALDSGTISAVLVLPENFTASVAARGPVPVKVITTQHLSAAESQIGAVLPGQIQLIINTALAGFAQRMGGTAAPTAAPEIEMLHASPGPAASIAGFVGTTAIWLSGLVGALMLFLATRGEAPIAGPLPVAAIRSALPVVATGLSSLVLSLSITTFTGTWESFVTVWAIVWLASYAVTAIMLGIFAFIGIWGIIIALPLAFFQPAVNTAQMPLAAAPDWLRWLGEALPLSAPITALRGTLIGGPSGDWIATGLLSALVGLALIWGGTYLWGIIRPSSKDASVHA